MNKYAEALHLVREKEPLVQCITNFVTVNDCANIILAAGGSPSMAHDVREAAEAARNAQALVCNMGAIEDAPSMILAGKEMNKLGRPVVLDPVAAGGTSLRREVAAELLKEVKFSSIRGNASEIRYLAGQQTAGSGVDVSALDKITEENLKETTVLRNGCATMARITGSGCMLTSMIGAFCGAMPEDCFTATVAAMSVMGISGEVAEARRIKNGTGNATFRTDLIDAVFNMTEEQLVEGMQYEIL